MMAFLSTLLLAISVSLDNLVVGLSYGIKKIKLSFISYIIIILLPTIATTLAVLFGKILFKYIPSNVAGFLGGSILIFIGLWAIRREIYCKNEDSQILNYEEIIENPEIIDSDKSGNIDIKEAIVLSLALAVNNIGIGIGVSAAGLNILFVALFTLIIGGIMLSVGNFIGTKVISIGAGKKANVASSILIIILGIYELFI